MLTSTCKKGTQALNYFARKKNGQINKMKAIKLVYLADRYHLRKYGRPVVGDMYWAMRYGPVGSNTLRIANLESENLDQECFKYARNFIMHPKGDDKKENITSKQEIDLDVFSQSDIEALEAVYKEFGDRDQFELADLTHTYHEWSKHKSDITSGRRRRVSMAYEDFFSDKNTRDGDFFQIDNEHLGLAKDLFLENQTSEAFLKG